MALIAHWPLNGNANDISGNELNGTPTDITYANGKIGQAADFSGSTTSNVNLGQSNLVNLQLDKPWSIVLWGFKNVNNGYFISKGANGSAGQQYAIWDDGSIRFTVGGISSSGVSIVNNTWYHFCLVNNGDGTAKTHINGLFSRAITIGTVEATTTDTLLGLRRNTSPNTGTAYPLSGLINDVRIYDHALTDMEIQEIARAKILHYTFDDMQEPTTNHGRMLESVSLAGGLAGSWSIQKLERDTVKVTALIDNPASATWGDITNVLTGTRTIIAGNPVTLSCEVVDFKGSLSRIFPASGGFGTLYAGTYGIFMNRVYRTITHTSNWTHNILIRVANNANILAGDYLVIRLTQIEEKSYPTEYTPASRTGLIRDYSGFFNDSVALTEVNTPRWTPEAKVGVGAYLFNGIGNSDVSGGVIIPESTLPSIAINNPFTIAFWFKATGTATAAIIRKEGAFELYKSGTSLVYRIWNPSQVQSTLGTFTINEWEHIVVLHNGTSTGKLFKNGVLQNTYSVSGTPSSITNVLGIGAYPNRTWASDCYIDDFRIYATELSDKDIKDLYEDRAEIEQSGVLYARDFLSNVEQTVNLLSNVIDTTFETTTGLGIYSGTTTVTDEITFNSHKVYKVQPAISGASGFNITSDIYVPANTVANMSFWVYIPETQTINGTFEIHRHALPDGTCLSGNCHWYSSVDYTNRTWDNNSPKGRWFRREITIQTNSYVPVNGYLLRSFVYNGGSNGGGYFYVAEPQIELKSYPTPFTKSFRPAIQLPSTIKFGANDIHETGTENYEDFSTVGITDGLIGYWPLEKNTKDVSGKKRDATASGAVLQQDSYYFDGVNDTLNFGTGDTFFPLYAHTISIMFRSDGTTESTGTSPALFGFTYGIRGFVGSNGFPNYVLYKVGFAASVSASDGYNYNDGLWHLYTATCDGTTMKLYLDSVDQGSANASAFWDGYTSWPTNSWNLGKDNNNVMYHFKGNMKQHKLFNRALTAEEIKIEYDVMVNNEVLFHESGTVYAKALIQY